MKNWHTLDVQFSDYQWVFPIIIGGLLILLLLIILIRSIIRKIKNGEKFRLKFTFFIDNYDKMKFYGSIVLLIAYGYFVHELGFLLATMIFVFLTSLLFGGKIKGKILLVSASNGVITSVVIWYLFGHVLNITLP